MVSQIFDRKAGLSSAAAYKGPCLVATTANIVLSGQQTVDGVAVVSGDRVLVKDQTDARYNGIWNVDTGDWKRAADFSRVDDVVKGTRVVVTGGTQAGNYQLDSDEVDFLTQDINFISASILDLTGRFIPTVVGGLEKVNFASVGSRLAFGSNSAPSSFYRGLQIAGGDPDEGDDGVILNAAGHASWPAATPSKNYSAIELAIYPTMAGGLCSRTIGGNTLTVTSGSTPNAIWIGNRIYLDRIAYKVSAVAGSVITVTQLNGSAVTWSATTSGKSWKVCYIYGTGSCTVAGSAVTRLSGDPFVIYNTNPSFIFKLNGIVKTVTAAPDSDHCTISSPPADGNYTFEYFFSINDQFATFRLHGQVADLENFAFYTSPFGNFIHSQSTPASGGEFQPIIITSGVRSDTLADFRQLIAHENGDVTVGGDYGYENVRFLSHEGIAPVNRWETQGAPTGFGPVWRARGADANVGAGIDMQGTGLFAITGGSFDHFIARFVHGATDKNYFDFISTANGIAPTIRAKASGSDTTQAIQIDGLGTTGTALRVSNNNSVTTLFEVKHDRFKSFLLAAYADDVAAAAGGIAVGEWFHSTTSGAIRQRRS